MPIPTQWRKAYARQAISDLEVYEFLSLQRRLPACHRLHYLQMYLEKVAKAYAWPTDAKCREQTSLGSGHSYVAKLVPRIFMEGFRRQEGRNPSGSLQKRIRELCREIDLLQPAADDGGKRPDNCEYPWNVCDNLGNASDVESPTEFPFQILDSKYRADLQTLMKVIGPEVRRLAE